MLIIIEGIVLLIGSQEGNHLKYSEWRYLSRPHFLHDDRYLAKVNTQPFRLFVPVISGIFNQIRSFQK